MKKIASDNIFLHMYTKSYDIQFLRYRVRWTEFFFYFGPFFALSSPNNPENQTFEKTKKTAGDILIFAVYPPPSPNNLENQDFEKMKNILKK